MHKTYHGSWSSRDTWNPREPRLSLFPFDSLVTIHHLLVHTQAKPSHSNQLLTEKWLRAKNYSLLNVYLKTSKSKSIYKDSHVKRPNFRAEIKSGTKHGCSLRSQLSPTTLHGLKPFSQLVNFLLKFNSWVDKHGCSHQLPTRLQMPELLLVCFGVFLYEYLKWFKRFVVQFKWVKFLYFIWMLLSTY